MKLRSLQLYNICQGRLCAEQIWLCKTAQNDLAGDMCKMFSDSVEAAATQLMQMHFVHIGMIFVSLCVPGAHVTLGPI